MALQKPDAKDALLYGLAIVIILGFVVLTGALVFQKITDEVSEAAFMVIGAWISGFSTVVGYFFGSSKSSVEKDKALEKSQSEMSKVAKRMAENGGRVIRPDPTKTEA